MQERTLRGAAIALAGTAVVLLAVVQFVPWATGASSEDMAMPGFGGFGGGTMRMDLEATAWFWEGEVAFNGASDDEGWYAEGWSDDGELADGVAMIRAAIPLLVTALAAALASAVLLGLGLLRERLRPIGAWVGGGAALLAGMGLALMAAGTLEWLEDLDGVLHVGFYLALAALLALLGAVVAAVVPAPGVQRADFA